MTAFEYIELRKKELNAFAEDWEKSREESPEDWPSTLDEGDWYEQETAFNEVKRGC